MSNEKATRSTEHPSIITDADRRLPLTIQKVREIASRFESDKIYYVYFLRHHTRSQLTTLPQ